VTQNGLIAQSVELRTFNAQTTETPADPSGITAPLADPGRPSRALLTVAAASSASAPIDELSRAIAAITRALATAHDDAVPALVSERAAMRTELAQLTKVMPIGSAKPKR
jgi:hypothetical protein